MSRRRSLGVPAEVAVRGRRTRFDHDYRAELEACIRQTDVLLRRSVRSYFSPRRQSLGKPDRQEDDQEFAHVKFDLTRKRAQREPGEPSPASIRDANKTIRPPPKPEFEVEPQRERSDSAASEESGGARRVERSNSAASEESGGARRVAMGDSVKARKPKEETIEDIFSSEVAVPAKPTRFLITEDIRSFRDRGRPADDANYSEHSSDDFHFVKPEPLSSSSGTSCAFRYPRIDWMESCSESESEEEAQQELLPGRGNSGSESESDFAPIPVARDIDEGPASPSAKKDEIRQVKSVLFKTFNTSDEDVNEVVTGDLFGDSGSSDTGSLSSRRKSVSESRSEPSFPKIVPSPSFDTVDDDLKE